MASKISARVSGTTGTKCCCDPPIITECRKRAGTATIVGWSELVGRNVSDTDVEAGAVVDFASVPPRKYLRRTFSGSTQALIHHYSWLISQVHTLSGYDQYNPVTATGTSSGSCHTVSLIDGAPLADQYKYSDANIGSQSPIEPRWALRDWVFNGTPPAGRTRLSISTTASTAASSLLCSDVSASGTITMTMDMEDTEDAAEVRSTATWGEWYLRGGTGCGTNDCCTAKRQLRTTGFSFTFQEAEFRLGIEEGTVGTAYTVAVDIIRKLTGGSTWSLVETQYFSVTSTEPGASHDGWGTYSVAQQRGYDVTIDNIRIYRAP